MGNIFDDVGEIVKREMVLFFLVDQSGSMAGKKIGSVNTAIREVIPELRGIGGSDANIKIAALFFSVGCRWMHSEPIAVENFYWTPVGTDGVTDFGAALRELSKKMSKGAFLSSPSASVAPAIFLMSDGQPTDDYKDALAQLKTNRWFTHAIKVAVAIGNDADTNVLAEFTGTPEAVIRVHTPADLMKLIRFITITSSQVASQNNPVASDGHAQTKQDAMIQNLQAYLNANPDIDQNASDDWD